MKVILFLVFTNLFSAQYLIRYKLNTSSKERLTSLRSFQFFNETIYITNESLQKIKKNSFIKDYEENLQWKLVVPVKIENKEEMESQWALKNKFGSDINVKTAWKKTKGSHELVIALIDTGIDLNHPELQKNIYTNLKEKNGRPGIDDDQNGIVDDIHGYDFYNNDNDPNDKNGHGTHCAGIIAAIHNGIGIRGVMNKVKILPIKFLSDSGSGTTENALMAIEYAIKMNANIMSNSWGGPRESRLLKEAIEMANKKRILFVVASGNTANDNDYSPDYPLGYQLSNMIGVASYNQESKISHFSSYGRKTVHVAAPGEKIISTFKNNKYKILSGTSMAVPHVSAIAGLLLSKEKLSPEKIKERLIKTSVPVKSFRRFVQSGGRVNAGNAVLNIIPPTNAPDEKLWKTKNFHLESDHPYKNDRNWEKVLVVKNAKYLRVVLKKIDLENGYDFLWIKNSKNEIVEKISGRLENYKSDFIEGNKIKIQFTSDYSKNYWGLLIEKIQYIP